MAKIQPFKSYLGSQWVLAYTQRTLATFAIRCHVAKRPRVIGMLFGRVQRSGMSAKTTTLQVNVIADGTCRAACPSCSSCPSFSWTPPCFQGSPARFRGPETDEGISDTCTVTPTLHVSVAREDIEIHFFEFDAV